MVKVIKLFQGAHFFGGHCVDLIQDEHAKIHNCTLAWITRIFGDNVQTNKEMGMEPKIQPGARLMEEQDDKGTRGMSYKPRWQQQISQPKALTNKIDIVRN